MNGVKEHYDELLGKYYKYLSPSLEQAAENLRCVGVCERDKKSLVIDYGSGTGVYSQALLSMGYESIIGVDGCGELIRLARLNYPEVHFKESQILTFKPKDKASLILCLGDTISHFGGLDEVESFLAAANEQLLDEGEILISYREVYLKDDTERFIHIVNNKELQHICFLESMGEKFRTTDIIMSADNNWEMEVGSYNKIHLSEKTLRELLVKTDFSDITLKDLNGLKYIKARKSHAL